MNFQFLDLSVAVKLFLLKYFKHIGLNYSETKISGIRHYTSFIDSFAFQVYCENKGEADVLCLKMYSDKSPTGSWCKW